jgi:4-hydroxyphenylpyruvate dioxygenase
LARTRRQLAERGATFVAGGPGNDAEPIEIATPIDDLNFRFLQADRAPRRGLDDEAGSRLTRLSSARIDHITINTGTVLPMLLWLQHVLGLEKHWETEFHTSDVRERPGGGSGLKSLVLWDPRSQIKFALNEPLAPNFFASQIELFRQDHGGSGVQHVAIAVHDIVGVVAGLRERGVKFAPIPATYYDQLPPRLERIGVGAIAEPLSALRRLGILVDGSGSGQYLLQIFIEDDAAFLGGSDRSPFFLELIERKGCAGFGAGNFRALFESIEHAQAARVGRPTSASARS